MRNSKYTLMLALKRVRQLFTDTQRKLNLILDHIDEAVVELDDQGVVTGWNARAESLLGWKKHEVIKQKLSGYVAPECLDPILRENDQRACVLADVTCAHGRPIAAALDFIPFRSGAGLKWCLFVREAVASQGREDLWERELHVA